MWKFRWSTMVTSTGLPTRVLAADSPAKPAPTMTTRCIGQWWHTGQVRLPGPVPGLSASDRASPELSHPIGTLATVGQVVPQVARGGQVMITGVIVGLVVGIPLGVVVGLLVRANQVTAASTAEARLADASALNQTLTTDLAGLRDEAARGSSTS